MFGKDTKLIAMDIETREFYVVDSIHYPLGKPSGKDIAIEVEDGLLEWRSIEDVIVCQVGIDLANESVMEAVNELISE